MNSKIFVQQAKRIKTVIIIQQKRNLKLFVNSVSKLIDIINKKISSP